MELYKTEYSSTKGKGKLDKILLNCENDSYYKLKDFLYTVNSLDFLFNTKNLVNFRDSLYQEIFGTKILCEDYTAQNNQAIVLNALYKCDINLVLKFGYIDSIIKEYNISKELEELPNFIKYFCKIECNDNIMNIINNKQDISNYKICNYGDEKIGILVMKYYKLGCVNDYEWNENNFDILKNIIKQVIFAVIQAYKIKGFIHGNLHCGNVLLKPKKNCIIIYETNKLIIEKYEVVIMDFEKSKLQQIDKITDLFRNVVKFVDSVINSNNMKLNIDYDRNRLNKLKSKFNEKIDYYYLQVKEIINDIVILQYFCTKN